MQDHPETRRISFGVVIELLLASAGAIACLGISAWTWQQLASVQPLWPIPALYFIEMSLVSLAGAAGVFLRRLGRIRRGELLTWIAAGMLFGFAIVGSFSVGLYYIPAGLAFLLAGSLSALRHKGDAGVGIPTALVAALAQAGLMLAVISWIYP